MAELPLLGLVIGAAIGAFIILLDTQYQGKRIRNGIASRPEDRLRTALFGGPALAAAMFWFSWSANYNYVHWIVPSLAGVLISAAMLCIFVPFINYLVDAYLMFAASAIAANTVLRSAAGAAAPLFTTQMFTALGVGGGGSLVGGVAALLALIPFWFYKYGDRIRTRSKFAPTSGPPDRRSDPADEAEKGSASGSGGEDGKVAAAGNDERRDSHMETLSDVEKSSARRGHRESLDSNELEYATEGTVPGRHRRDVEQKI